MCPKAPQRLFRGVNDEVFHFAKIKHLIIALQNYELSFMKLLCHKLTYT